MKVAKKMRGGSRSGLRSRSLTGGGRAQVAPPALEADQFRCPSCRNGTTLTTRGYLRQHNDLFGNRCYNRGVGVA